MKKMENVPYHGIDQGWTVHVYSSDRRLLCTLNASHCWSLVIGLALGIVLTASWFGHSYSELPQSSIDEPMSAPLGVD
jgi:hypothetical protein